MVYTKVAEAKATRACDGVLKVMVGCDGYSDLVQIV